MRASLICCRMHAGDAGITQSGTCMFPFNEARQLDQAAKGCSSKARQALRLTFGTKAKNRRGLSFMICRRTSSLAPAFFTLGTKTVSVFA